MGWYDTRYAKSSYIGGARVIADKLSLYAILAAGFASGSSAAATIIVWREQQDMSKLLIFSVLALVNLLMGYLNLTIIEGKLK